MNRKLFRLITIFVTVLIALAFTSSALANPPVNDNSHFENDYLLLYCGEDEIWAHQDGLIQTRYRYDERGELVEVFWHVTDQFHLYNFNHPELYIDGMSAGNGHSTKIGGEWTTGIEFNFHAPGVPQLSHTSGYWWWDEEGMHFEHGRVVFIDFELGCELLTP